MPSPQLTYTSVPATQRSPSSIAGRNDPAKGSDTTTRTDKIDVPAGERYVITFYPDCAAHHAPNAPGFPSVTQATTSDELHHLDVQSLKNAVNSLVQDFGRGNQPINVPYVNISTYAGELMRSSDWEKIRNTLSRFGQSVGRPSVLSAQYHNELINAYITKSRDCLCNSDCHCNSVCTCNLDCGCNYSDKRLKKDLTFIKNIRIDNTLIKWYSFYYNDVLDLPDNKQYGVIAQDLIEAGLEKYVDKLPNGFYQVNYGLILQENPCPTIQV